jgi:hypothetical protein
MRIQGLFIRLGLAVIISVTLLSQSAAAQGSSELSDDKVQKLLIQRSIAGYSGSCPCPYNIDRGNRRCGGRSAYSRPGGRSPLCYPRDVTPDMIRRYRQSQQQ